MCVFWWGALGRTLMIVFIFWVLTQLGCSGKQQCEAWVKVFGKHFWHWLTRSFSKNGCFPQSGWAVISCSFASTHFCLWFTVTFLINCISGSTAADYRQGPRVWRQFTVQPDSAAADVADTGGPGAPPAGESHRPHSLQTRRPRATLRPQDPCRHRAAADRWRLLCPCWGPRDHLQPGQGRKNLRFLLLFLYCWLVEKCSFIALTLLVWH